MEESVCSVINLSSEVGYEAVTGIAICVINIKMSCCILPYKAHRINKNLMSYDHEKIMQ
jgi:hypothetical protein